MASQLKRLLALLRRVKRKLAPPGSLRERIFIPIPKGNRAAWHQANALVFQHSILHSRLLYRQSWAAYAFDSFLRARRTLVNSSTQSVQVPGRAGLVSIILPICTSEEIVQESIESVLAQTYPHFELIILNNSPADNTAEILEKYAARDARIRVLPDADQQYSQLLSQGCRLAQGEFLTWIIAGNRFKPDFLAKMVHCLRQHPGWDMVYANMDIIDHDGQPLQHASWYQHYQQPQGSAHIVFPSDTAELNTTTNNYVGAAFMYRTRVAYLLGDYHPIHAGAEDYDYWLRINALLTLRHVDFPESVYEHRFSYESMNSHGKGETSRSTGDKLLLFDDFRRDFYLTPMIWVVTNTSAKPKLIAQCEKLVTHLTRIGHTVLKPEQLDFEHLPVLYLPIVYVRFTDTPAFDSPPSGHPVNVVNILITPSSPSLPTTMDNQWNLCIALGSHVQLPRLARTYQGWVAVPDIAAALLVMDVRVRSEHLALIGEAITNPEPPSVKISVVICTYKRNDRLVMALEAIAKQTVSHAEYEVLVVNNNDECDAELAAQINALRVGLFADTPGHLRYILCPLLGLSHARNVGFGAARGRYVVFLDDDCIAQPTLLAKLLEAYSSHPDAGVIGGRIILNRPDPLPAALKSGWEIHWGDFPAPYTEYTEVEQSENYPWGGNWSAPKAVLLISGGFRTRYGRKGSDFSGGEEILAAMIIKRLGYPVAIMPDAEVIHDVDPSRFTFEHVERTVLAGTMIYYQLQKDNFLPFYGIPGFTPIVATDEDVQFTQYRRAAQKHLRRAFIVDSLKRMKPPISG